MFDITRLMQDFGNPETNRLAAELKEILEQSKFDIRSPIEITNRGAGPALNIIQRGVEQHRVITAKDETGAVVELGIGAGSRGVIANEFLPDPNFSLDPTLVNDVFSTQGNINPETARSLLSEGTSGTGVPGTEEPYVPVAGWGEAFSNLQKSNDTEHPPGSAVKITRTGNKYWWSTDPWKWMVVRATVTAINEDTLTCSVVANNNVSAEEIVVAKPCYLRQTGWDGVTTDGVSYVYTTSQTREATTTGDSSQEDQAVSPLYSLDGPCPVIFAAWVGNDSGVSNVGWIDLNLDARQWFAV